MLRKKGKKEVDISTLASVKKEMAKPRTAKSVRITRRNLDTARISERLPAVVRSSKRSKRERIAKSAMSESNK